MTEPRAYYNEIDPYCAEWLYNLQRANLIAPGDIDTRPIQDVRPSDLRGYTQCHFFAGLGGWSYALRRAGWRDDRPVWTGSCPCQPFSQAGRRRGFADDRHLWPFWRYLVAIERPAVVFGEQVASAADWLRLVRGDMEGLGYAVGAMPVEAASAGADHRRDRYWFVANLHDAERRTSESVGHEFNGKNAGRTQSNGHASKRRNGDISDVDEIVVRRKSPTREQSQPQQDQKNCNRALFDATGDGWGEGWTEDEIQRRGITAPVASIGNSTIFESPDGKWRRLPPPGVRWLGNGIPARIPKLRALGNAIDWRPAARFIEAYMTLDNP